MGDATQSRVDVSRLSVAECLALSRGQELKKVKETDSFAEKLEGVAEKLHAQCVQRTLLTGLEDPALTGSGTPRGVIKTGMQAAAEKAVKDIKEKLIDDVAAQLALMDSMDVETAAEWVKWFGDRCEAAVSEQVSGRHVSAVAAQLDDAIQKSLEARERLRVETTREIFDELIESSRLERAAGTTTKPNPKGMSGKIRVDLR